MNDFIEHFKCRKLNRYPCSIGVIDCMLILFLYSTKYFLSLLFVINNDAAMLVKCSRKPTAIVCSCVQYAKYGTMTHLGWLGKKRGDQYPRISHAVSVVEGHYQFNIYMFKGEIFGLQNLHDHNGKEVR